MNKMWDKICAESRVKVMDRDRREGEVERDKWREEEEMGKEGKGEGD